MNDENGLARWLRRKLFRRGSWHLWDEVLSMGPHGDVSVRPALRAVLVLLIVSALLLTETFR
jgi:hypothetical protein